MNAVDTDLSVIEHLDFEVMCESNWHKPEFHPYIGPVESAIYVASFSCPGCSKHFEKFLGARCIVKWRELSGRPFATLECESCKGLHSLGSWGFKYVSIK